MAIKDLAFKDSIGEYLRYYSRGRLGIWICPSDTNAFYSEWKHINTEELYIEKYNSFNWSSTSCINLVTGKKGCIVLFFEKEEEKGYSEARLKDILSILELPEKYPWVIERKNNYGIVLDVYNLPKGQIIKKYRDFYLIWESYYTLPPGEEEYPCKFKYGRPSSHPKQLSWQNFQSKLDSINKLRLFVDNIVLEQRRKNMEIGNVIIGCSVLLVVLAITIFYAVLYDASFTRWFIMFIVTSLAVYGLIYITSH